jgi:hypothetical protein
VGPVRQIVCRRFKRGKPEQKPFAKTNGQGIKLQKGEEDVAEMRHRRS